MKVKYTVLEHLNYEVVREFPDSYTDKDIERAIRAFEKGTYMIHPKTVFVEVIEWQKS